LFHTYPFRQFSNLLIDSLIGSYDEIAKISDVTYLAAVGRYPRRHLKMTCRVAPKALETLRAEASDVLGKTPAMGELLSELIFSLRNRDWAELKKKVRAKYERD
jgi:hypothetical protein